MGFGSLVLTVLGLSLIAFYASRVKALSLAKPLGGIQQLASLPFFYGMRAAIWCALPALALLIIWSLFDNHIISTIVLSNLPDSVKPTNLNQHNLLINSIENISSGALDPQFADPNLVSASKILNQLNNTAQKLLTILILSVSIFSMSFAWIRVSPKLHARQMVENFFKWTLLTAACLAIFATLGKLFFQYYLRQ